MINELTTNQELLQELARQRRSQKKWLIVFACVAFFVLIVLIVVSLAFIDSDFVLNLQDGNASVSRNYDYLQFVVPVLLAMGAFMAAALGVNRLRNLDDQVEKIEARLDKKFEQHEKSSEISINAKISAEIEKKAEDYVKKLEIVTEASKQAIASLTEDTKIKIDQERLAALGSIQERFDGIDIKLNTTQDLVNQFNNEYAWLKSSSGVIDPDSIAVQSVADAHLMVESLFRKTDITKEERAKQVRVVVKKVLSEELTGDTADYHNLSAELARNELKDLAIKICDSGLQKFPYDEDLIADVIQFATAIGEKLAGIRIKDYVERLREIDQKSWSWRCFEFLADFYISVKDYKKAEQTCEDYIKFLPRDERGYAQLAEIYDHMYTGVDAEDKKISILKKAVEMGFACPRCANSLATLYADRGELEKAIYYSGIAILSLAQDQPSVNYAYVIYRRALYEDRLFLKKRLEGITDDKLLKSALADYKEVIDSNRLSVTTSNQARVRYNLLAGYDSEAKKYSNGVASTADILSALSQLTREQSNDSKEVN